MVDTLQQYFSMHPTYAWWAAALVLLAFEILMPSNWLLWPGLAAFITGLVALLVPGFTWQMNIVVFVALSMVMLLMGRRFVKLHTSETDAPHLNNRIAQLVGRKGAALYDGNDGTTKIRIDDTEWPARDESWTALRRGDLLEIIGSDKAMLIVRRID